MKSVFIIIMGALLITSCAQETNQSSNSKLIDDTYNETEELNDLNFINNSTFEFTTFATQTNQNWFFDKNENKYIKNKKMTRKYLINFTKSEEEKVIVYDHNFTNSERIIVDYINYKYNDYNLVNENNLNVIKALNSSIKNYEVINDFNIPDKIITGKASNQEIAYSQNTILTEGVTFTYIPKNYDISNGRGYASVGGISMVSEINYQFRVEENYSYDYMTCLDCNVEEFKFQNFWTKDVTLNYVDPDLEFCILYANNINSKRFVPEFWGELYPPLNKYDY